MTPIEYITKLTDYSEVDKHLNYLMSYYLPGCNVNVITKIGFGMGRLKRVNNLGGLKHEQPGVPYRLSVGRSWTPQFPYTNPGDFLTFRWFKIKIICADQPWICGLHRNDSQNTVSNWWKRLSRRNRNK